MCTVMRNWALMADLLSVIEVRSIIDVKGWVTW